MRIIAKINRTPKYDIHMTTKRIFNFVYSSDSISKITISGIIYWYFLVLRSISTMLFKEYSFNESKISLGIIHLVRSQNVSKN